jgi:2-polyprenyl-6-methoxyphenol hydroxylase-like FAD-dependent oxidoreductase
MAKVLVAGGGIGGLSAAIALAQAGHAVRVFERAEALRAAGAGITMQSNAMRVFASLGLDSAVRAAGREIELACITDTQGRALQTASMAPVTQALGQPSVAIHRAALLEVLAEGARAAGAQIEVGAGISRVEQRGDFVVAGGEGWEVEGDVVVGADGLHSAVRRALRGDEPLRYSGYTTWRGVSPDVNPSRGGETWEAWGRGQRFGVVPLADGQTYWFAVQDAPAGGVDGADAAQEVAARFEGWFEEAGALIRATPELLRTDCFDRPPIRGDWGVGRVTLLGDAAHPMTPNMGQGGGQSVEDAWALARALDGAADVAGALRAYERGRSARAAMFVDRSWSLGRVAQWSAAPACWLRDGLIGMVPARTAANQLIAVLGGA